MKNKKLLGIGIVSLLVSLVSFGAFFILRQTGFVLGKSTSEGKIYYVAPTRAAVNQPYTLIVMANSGKVNVNAAGLYLRFDPQKIRVTEIDTLKSFCQFYPEKKFDNQQGIVSLACGSPHPGFKGEAEIMRVSLVPLVVGTSSIRMDVKSSLLSSDGKGTDILTDYPTWEVTAGESL